MTKSGNIKIPITKTVFGPEEFQAVQQPLESGWVVQGPFVRELLVDWLNFTLPSYAQMTKQEQNLVATDLS